MLFLTREQVRKVDQIAIEQFAMPGIVLMENAARGAVEVIRRSLPHARPLILCGGGNNGGDGLAIARHLHNAGSNVAIGLCTDASKYAGDALINWRIVQAMGLPVFPASPSWLAAFALNHRTDLIVDAIFGTGLATSPRDPFADLVRAITQTRIPVVAIDLPSGLDCDLGTPIGAEAVRASLTVTFVAMKQGFQEPAARQYLGEVEVVDIGCPREAIERAKQAKTR